MIIWVCATFEILFYMNTLFPIASVSPLAATMICPAAEDDIRTTPLFVIGVVAVVLGSYIRVDCFRTLGEMFTFDLTIHPRHKLVTGRFYSYVRHPAYTGSILVVAGLAFSHLTSGSWLTECGPLQTPGSAGLVWAMWWIWTLAVGFSRAQAEDKEMRKLFGVEWDKWAVDVPW
jgi:protein-S-isoprenylcysteine O-methyltransferase Ste14